MKPQIIDNPQTVQLLLNSDLKDCLAQLMANPASVAALAKKLGRTIGVTHYRVQQLLEHGLIEVVSEQKRAGRTVKFYESSAKAFFIPFAATNFETLLTFWLAILEPKHQFFIRHLIGRAEDKDQKDWGLMIQYTSEQGLHFSNAGTKKNNPVQPVAWFTEEDFLLSHTEAKDFQQELKSLIAKYKNATGSARYVLQTGLVWVNEA